MPSIGEQAAADEELPRRIATLLFTSEGVHAMKHRPLILALAGAIGLAAASAALADQPSYRISDTLVGSMLPQDIIRAPVPFDGRYADLTADQKATLASDYENLPAGDEPPFPLYGLRHMVKPLVRFADTYSPVGSVVASVMVDSQGHAGEVTVYKSPDPQLTRVVTGMLAFETFKPASCQGQPCKMAYVLRLDFPSRGGQPVQTAAFNRFDSNSHSLNSH